MPINFVRNPLLNPHESKAQSLYSPFEDPHTHTHTFKLIYTHAEGERVGNNVYGRKERGQMGSI